MGGDVCSLGYSLLDVLVTCPQERDDGVYAKGSNFTLKEGFILAWIFI